MVVTILDVRALLNDITVEELVDLTIQQNIEDSQTILNLKIPSPVSAELFDIAVKYLAGYKSFVVSNTFKSAKFGPLSVQRDVQGIANALKVQLEEAVADASPSDFKLKVAYMFSDRNIATPTKSII